MDKDAIESSIIIDLFKEEYKLDFEALLESNDVERSLWRFDRTQCCGCW